MVTMTAVASETRIDGCRSVISQTTGCDDQRHGDVAGDVEPAPHDGGNGQHDGEQRHQISADLPDGLQERRRAAHEHGQRHEETGGGTSAAMASHNPTVADTSSVTSVKRRARGSLAGVAKSVRPRRSSVMAETCHDATGGARTRGQIGAA